jgi:DNA-directed RNA polymerase specialized sigma subunit
MLLRLGEGTNMKLSWNNITEKELKHLYYDTDLTDKQIAEIFGISKSKVAYKRKKLGISFRE